MATLEFAMALPVLLLLMVAITWLGFSVIGQTEVIIEAHNKTWTRRFENASDKPLYFPILPLYERDSDFVSEKASKTVDVSPIFKKVPGPQASDTILAGSWDHNAMPFKEPPHLKLMAVAAAVGWGGNVLDYMSQITNPLGLLKQMGNRAKSEAANAPTTVTQNTADSGTSGGGNVPGAPGGGMTPEQGKQQTEQQRQAEIAAKKQEYRDLGGRIEMFGPLAGRITPVRGELLKKNEEKKKLQDDRANVALLAQNETDAEKKKKLQEDAARIQRQIDLADIEYRRLEAKFLDVVDDLDALGIDKYEQLSI
jgi:hypothetical protein